MNLAFYDLRVTAEENIVYIDVIISIIFLLFVYFAHRREDHLARDNKDMYAQKWYVRKITSFVVWIFFITFTILYHFS
ncbi:hypothetical protein FC093_20825 [Ilyomonas limi]|uniref:Uncharacterized protein n=1 Tax=Ilyomonas limi TaxID=2575867 RepID=A0A4V5UTH8_9BACT|nr:hypothetical protein [Ilyomonas limi]TKK65113.1 hypothetical protein FC093_20825 [Ilyomonas limi]